MEKFSLTEWNNKFKKMFWGPATKIGNPLYKRTQSNNDKKFIQQVEGDAEYAEKINSTFTSPSNVRALIIGVNRAYVILHRGMSKGENKVVEIKAKQSDWIYPDPIIDETGNNYDIYGYMDLVKDQSGNVDLSQGKLKLKAQNPKAPKIQINTNTFLKTCNLFALPNLECLVLTWNSGATPGDVKQFIENKNRFCNFFYIEQGLDDLLKQNENQIREYAKSKYTKLNEFMPQLSEGCVIDNDVDLKTNLFIQPGQWEYDDFLAGWNEQLAKEEHEKQPVITDTQEAKYNYKDTFKNNISKLKKYINNSGTVVCALHAPIDKPGYLPTKSGVNGKEWVNCEDPTSNTKRDHGDGDWVLGIINIKEGKVDPELICVLGSVFHNSWHLISNEEYKKLKAGEKLTKEEIEDETVSENENKEISQDEVEKIKALYISGKISSEEMQKRLQQLGITKEDADLLINQLNEDNENPEFKEIIQGYKELNKNDSKQWYADYWQSKYPQIRFV